jgi:hypothetical protein
MRKDISIEDIVCNIFHRDKSLEEHAADLGELIIDREREESVFGGRSPRTAKLERMITLQKKLILRMINGDEEEFLQPRSKKRKRLATDRLAHPFLI